MTYIIRCMEKKRDYFKVQGNPMVRIIRARDFRKFIEGDYNIPYETTVKSIDDVKKALKAGSRISATGGVTVMTDRFLTSCSNPKRPHKTLLSYIQKLIDESDEKNPLMAILTNPPGRIPVLTQEEAEEQESLDREFAKINDHASSKEADNHQFLKAPLTDEMLIEALTTAAAAMLNDEHAARMKWKDGVDYYEKEYGLNHLLVCLFYYINESGLNASSSFFFHQRTPFHEYCSQNLPAELSVCTERYFRNCLTKLQWKSCSFDEYIHSGRKPQGEWQKGQFNVEFWFAIYREAAGHFRKILQPEG